MPTDNVTATQDSTTPPPPTQAPAVSPPPAQPQNLQTQIEQWRSRFQGQQRVNVTLTEQLGQLTTERDQQTAQAETLTTRVDELATNVETLQSAQTEQSAALVSAQADVAFYQQITSPEYARLAPFAAVIQRDADPERQKVILDQFSATLGQQVTTRTEQGVSQALQGVVPGASLPAGQVTKPSYKEVIAVIMGDNDIKTTNPALYEQYLKIYRNDPEFGHESLGRGKFQDPFESDYDSMAAAQQRGDDATSPPPNMPFGTPLNR